MKTRARQQRQDLGTVTNGREFQDGEVRVFGSWVIVRKPGRRYVATCGSAMTIERGNLTDLCRHIEEHNIKNV